MAEEAGEMAPVANTQSALARRWTEDRNRAKQIVSKWRKEAREADEFYVNYQWKREDEQKLNEEDRPTAVFNYAAKFLRIVSGSERQNRMEIMFVPRVPQRDMMNALGELSSAVYSSVIDQVNGDDERSIAFEDLLRRGMGWTNVRLDMELNNDGTVILERVDGLKMWWDTAARKQNLEDARWLACAEDIPMQEAIRRWPEKEFDIRSSELLKESRESFEEPMEVEHVTPIEYDPINETPEASLMPAKGYVTLIEYQYYDIEPFYRLADPQTGNVKTFTEEQFTKLRRRLQPLGVIFTDKNNANALPGLETTIAYVRSERRVYKRAFFIGPVELESGDMPVQGVGFTYKPMTGFFDGKDKIWRGLLYTLMDPQRFANKFFSQVLHIINSNAKGGLMAETSAFVDPVKAEQDWSNPQALILLQEGALSGDKPKITERSRAQLPEGVFVMLKWCVDALGGVSGINPELLGATTGDVPGIAQRQRQIQGMTINADFFGALKRYLRNEARCVFEFIRNFVADGRLVRLGTAYQAQAIPLLRDQLPLEYDLIIDEATMSPNAKEVTWQNMTPLLPTLVKFAPEVIPDVLDYSPFPSSVVARIKQRAQQMQQAAAQQPPGGQQGGKGAKDPREVEATVQQKSAAAELARTRAAAIMREVQLKDFTTAVSAADSIQDMRNRTERHEADTALRRQKGVHTAQKHALDQLGKVRTLIEPGVPQEAK